MAKKPKSKDAEIEEITGVYIANPVYDVVFKYLMEDNAIAKLVVSSIIGENIVHLKPKPQEYTIEKIKAEGENPLSVYRLDFAATIKTESGAHKLVTVEMQKAGLPTDIMRFRRYLGDRYCDESNRSDDGKALQIYTIYITGDNHILNVREEDFPEKYRPIIRRLKAAASNRTIKRQMREEDGFARYMQDWLYSESKALEATIKEQALELDQKDKELDDLRKQMDELKKMMK